MANTFDQIFAADPSNPSNVAQNASITIFAPGDTSMTPLTITDPDGQPLANPIPVNANGFGSAFAHATLDRVAWAGGGFTGYFTSYEGMKGEAVAAREAAETAAATAGTDAAAVATAAIGTATDEAEAAAASAATAASNASASATAAANSAALVGAPADTAIAAAINGSATATKTALNATYGPASDSMQTAFGLGSVDGAQTAVWFGDSIVAQCEDETLSETQGYYNAYSWYNWANMFLGHRLRMVRNAGIGGNTTAQMLARIDTDVLAYPSDWVVMDGGVNDLFNGAGTTLAQTQANLTAIFEKIIADGRRIAMMVTTTSGYANPATTLQNLYALHDWLREYARTNRGIVLFDGNGYWSDPADGLPLAGYARPGDATPESQNRGVHPGYLGAAGIGRALAEALEPYLVRAGVGETPSNADTRNVLTNGRMLGDQGNGLATGYSIVKGSDGTAATFTARKLPRPDGKPGAVQEIYISPADYAAQFPKIFIQDTAPGVRWNVGDKVYLQVDFETDPDTAGCYPGASNIAFWNGLGSVTTLGKTSNDGTLPAGVDVLPRKGVLRSPAKVVPAGTARLQLNVNLPYGTTRITSIQIRKVV